MIDCQPTPIGSLDPAQTFMGFPFENQGSNKPPWLSSNVPVGGLAPPTLFEQKKENKSEYLVRMPLIIGGSWAQHASLLGCVFCGACCLSSLGCNAVRKEDPVGLSMPGLSLLSNPLDGGRC